MPLLETSSSVPDGGLRFRIMVVAIVTRGATLTHVACDGRIGRLGDHRLHRRPGAVRKPRPAERVCSSAGPDGVTVLPLSIRRHTC